MTPDQLLDLLANHGGSIVRTASLNSAEIAAARIESRMAVREDGCGFVHIPERATAGNTATITICETCDGDGCVQCGGFGDLLGSTTPVATAAPERSGTLSDIPGDLQRYGAFIESDTEGEHFMFGPNSSGPFVMLADVQKLLASNAGAAHNAEKK